MTPFSKSRIWGDYWAFYSPLGVCNIFHSLPTPKNLKNEKIFEFRNSLSLDSPNSTIFSKTMVLRDFWTFYSPLGVSNMFRLLLTKKFSKKLRKVKQNTEFRNSLTLGSSILPLSALIAGAVEYYFLSFFSPRSTFFFFS